MSSAYDLDSDDLLAETVGDAALGALLRCKPPDEQIPAAVWWLTAETLRTSVAVRRVAAANLPTDADELAMLITEATLLTDAALAELAETTGTRPTPVAVPSHRGVPVARSATRPAFGLQLSVLFLARMLVSHRVTTAQRLANTLAAHLRALAVIDATVAAAR
jgi:hypothetical protein